MADMGARRWRARSVARVGGEFSHGAFRKSDDIPLPRFMCLDPLNNNLSRDWSSVNSMEIG